MLKLRQTRQEDGTFSYVRVGRNRLPTNQYTACTSASDELGQKATTALKQKETDSSPHHLSVAEKGHPCSASKWGVAKAHTQPDQPAPARPSARPSTTSNSYDVQYNNWLPTDLLLALFPSPPESKKYPLAAPPHLLA
jgi:hypothetical protein